MLSRGFLGADGLHVARQAGVVNVAIAEALDNGVPDIEDDDPAEVRPTMYCFSRSVATGRATLEG